MAVSAAEAPEARLHSPGLRLVPRPDGFATAHEHEWRLVAVDFDDLGPGIRVFECTGCRDVRNE